MTITLREHLDGIADVMALQGASSQQILYYQLYLLCLGLHGFRGFGIREARHDEPFASLDRLIPGMWDLASEQFNNDGESPLGLYLSDDDLAYIPDEEFIRTFDELLTSLARDARNTSFDHLQPSELSDLVCRLCAFKEGMTVYNPFAGVASYAAWLNAGDSYFAEEYDLLTWGIGVLSMWIHNCESANYICGDSLDPKWGRRFDRIVSTPPMGLIPGTKQSYMDCLLEALPTLLKEDGEAIIVTTGSAISGVNARELLNTGLLDAVIVLPQHVFYWAPYPAVIVKLRCGRSKADPVTLMDGTYLCSPGGRNTTLIDAERIYQAFIGKDRGFCVELTEEKIRAKCYRLHPAAYYGSATNADGIPIYFLSDLGQFIKPGYVKEKPAVAIKVRDLQADLTMVHKVQAEEVEEEEFRRGKYRLLDRPALLIHGTRGGLKFALADKVPVAVQGNLLVFEPFGELIDTEYLAYALSKAELADMGSSVFVINEDNLGMTKIPVPSIKKQKSIVKTVLSKEVPKLETAGDRPGTLSRKKLNVVVVGEVDIPEGVLEDVSVIRKFAGIGEVKAWRENNKGAVNALVIHHSKEWNVFDVAILCERVKPMPVFIVSDDPPLLEESFGNWACDYLPGRCYEPGQEAELFAAMFSFFDQKDSPQGRLREVYSRQLEAAASLDSKFRYEGYVLCEKLEEILMSMDGSKDWSGELRSIRDNCFLKELSRYGFLPPYNEKSFTWGAMVDLLADRAKNNSEGIFVLMKEILPKNLALMLKSCSTLLNQGAHLLVKSDRDTQWAALHVIMSVLCHLSEMVDSGKFDRMEPEKTAVRYWIWEDPLQFESGRYEVESLEGKPSYLYAGKVHLDNKVCQKEGIGPGDWVKIERVDPEGHPVFLDHGAIVFYSKNFHKEDS